MELFHPNFGVKERLHISEMLHVPTVGVTHHIENCVMDVGGSRRGAVREHGAGNVCISAKRCGCSGRSDDAADSRGDSSCIASLSYSTCAKHILTKRSGRANTGPTCASVSSLQKPNLRKRQCSKKLGFTKSKQSTDAAANFLRSHADRQLSPYALSAVSQASQCRDLS
jgi:hypothetical protein